MKNKKIIILIILILISILTLIGSSYALLIKTLTPRTEANGLKLGYADIDGTINNSVSTNSLGIKPAMNLKSNVVITGGDGT